MDPKQKNITMFRPGFFMLNLFWLIPKKEIYKINSSRAGTKGNQKGKKWNA